MARARKKTQPDINGMTAKQMRRKKPINSDYLLNIEPLTDNQRIMFEQYGAGKNIYASGCAGIGEVGDWRNKMNKTHPGWSEHMNKMAKMPYSQVEW